MEYKVLNLEEDPLTQGFSPGQFDLVCACYVIHATKDLKETCRNIRTLTADQGLLLFLESAKPAAEVDLAFGLLEGYWRFEDFDIRPDHCIISAEKWKQVLSSEGYGAIQSINFHMDDSCFVSAQVERNKEEKMTRVKKPTMMPTWVIFCDEKNYTEELKKHFNMGGRRVIEIRKNSKIARRLNDFEFEIRPNDKSDMEKVFTTLKDMSVLIEGILYSWHIGDADLNQEDITLPYLHLCQTIVAIHFKSIPKVFVVTQGQIYIGDQGKHFPGTGIIWGMSKCFRNEYSSLSCRCIDIDPDHVNIEELFMELWTNDQEYQVSYRDSKRYVRRYSPLTSDLMPLTLPNKENYGIKLPETKSINDLVFTPLTFEGPLKEDEIEVQVKANGLNFRDILVVLSASEEFGNFKVLGADFSGIVTQVGSKVTEKKIGDAVFGCNFQPGALPSHLRVPRQDLLMTLPDNMTFCEGATLPIVASTAYHCLIELAKIKANDTVLIHTASGGVGLAAVQYCQATGAKIIATAGSNRKRAYLRALGIQHVFHSRNTNYEKEIMKITNNKGVNVVLNSLTSPGFKEASLNVLAPSGKFVEMSKLEIWTRSEVKSLREDVTYEIVDLSQIKAEDWSRLFKKVGEHVASGMLKPLPYERFENTSIREALTYLRKAKHVGKVVVSTPNRVFGNGEYVIKAGLFNDRSTYLITGGFGGVGLEVAKWMATQGAKHIVLVGRSQPNDKAKEVIAYLTKEGKNIQTKFLDIGDIDKCRELIDFIQKSKVLPPLRGIMHAAGTLADARMETLNWGSFEKTFRSKVTGTWNLHSLTRELKLEHFVLYSTIVTISGNNGQTTHAAANSFMDSFAYYRHSLGLTALTVNWGQWGQIGVASELKATGVTPFSPAQAFSALEILMKNHKTQGVVEDIDHQLLKKIFPSMQKYFEELEKYLGGTEDNSSLSTTEGNGLAKFSLEYTETDGETEKYLVVKKYVEIIVRNALKLDVDELVDEDLNFIDMGVDSLMMIEMKNSFQIMTNGQVTLDVAALAERQTLRAMSEHLHSLLQNK